jgi:hypothetical protein
VGAQTGVGASQVGRGRGMSRLLYLILAYGDIEERRMAVSILAGKRYRRQRG